MKIALTGPESTGKTTTAQFLSQQLNAPLVPEMARKYIHELGKAYSESDLLAIAKLQCMEEDRLYSSNNLLICDTTLLVIKVWSLYKYGRCNSWIADECEKRKYDLHLLSNIDIPWVKDEQREHEEMRDELFNRYHLELIRSGDNYEILTGYGSKRHEKALQLIYASGIMN